MTPQVFDILEKMSYRELLEEAEKQKTLLYNQEDKVNHQDMEYYTAILQELDNRQNIFEGRIL